MIIEDNLNTRCILTTNIVFTGVPPIILHSNNLCKKGYGIAQIPHFALPTIPNSMKLSFES